MEQLWKNLANPRSSVADPPLFRRDENGGCRTRVSACFDLESHFNRSPELLGPEEIRSYQVYLTNERKLAPSSISIAISALRFLYRITLHKDWSLTEVIPTPKKPQKLPIVPSPEEVLQFLGCVWNIKHRTILTVCYAAGLSKAMRSRPMRRKLLKALRI